MQYNTITIQYNIEQYNTKECNAIQYNAVEYNTIQWNTIKKKERHDNTHTHLK